MTEKQNNILCDACGDKIDRDKPHIMVTWKSGTVCWYHNDIEGKQCYDELAQEYAST